jgi:thiamine-phosphate pyrophosphorylase
MNGRVGADLVSALRLVIILDAAAARGRDLASLARAAEAGGATMLQLRDKAATPALLAESARRIIAATSLPLIINDRLDVALATGAAGCHLGQDDVPLGDARRIAPPGFILGGSAGNEEEARRASKAGAHYLGIGPVRTTDNKPDAGAAIGLEGFRRVRAAAPLPCAAIGGITASDVAPLRRAGADGVAVIGAALGSDDVEAAVRLLAGAA